MTRDPGRHILRLTLLLSLLALLIAAAVYYFVPFKTQIVTAELRIHHPRSLLSLRTHERLLDNRHEELDQYADAAATLEQMIVQWADRTPYWLQLCQTYQQLHQDDSALAVLALAHRRNLLDAQAEIRLLSDLYAARGVPYRAAQVLEIGMAGGLVSPDREHWARAADLWVSAQEQERALVAYARAAAQAADGIPDLRRGYLLADLERWRDVVDALGEAFGKGGLDANQTGEALLLRGMAHFNLEQFDRAMADWERAARYEKSRQSARQWLIHMRETLRQATS